MRSEQRVVVAEDRDARRFDIVVGGEQAGAAHYRQHGDIRIFTHTVVLPSFAHQGLGGILARAALDDARAAGYLVVPQCPFIEAYIREHREYLDIVESSQRARFVSDSSS